MPSPLDPAMPGDNELGRFFVAEGVGLPPITACRWCRGPLTLLRALTTSHPVCRKCDALPLTNRKDPAA